MRFPCYLFILLIVCACNASSHQKSAKTWMQNDGKLKVLATTGMVGDLVSNIGGDKVDTFVLIGEELDPHSYQLVKGDDEKLSHANVVFYNGLNLEHGPSLHSALKKHPKAVGIGDAIKAKHPEKILTYSGQLDPHIWMDMSLWAEAIPVIVATLSEASPSHAKEFAENGKQLNEKLKQAHQDIYQKLHTIPSDKRYLVTSHDAFNYFARAYLSDEKERVDNNWQKRFAAPEGLSPDSQLSAADIQAIINHLDQYDIMVIFPESNVSKDSIRKIVDAGKKKGLILTIATEALYGDAMGPKGSDGDTYIKMIQHNANIISKYLKVNGKEERQAALYR